MILRVLLLVGIIVSAIIGYFWTSIALPSSEKMEEKDMPIPLKLLLQNGSGGDGSAEYVFGTRVEWSMDYGSPIEAVYAYVGGKPVKGIVLLLHGCSHNALKFYSPSIAACQSCIGLSEEMRIASLAMRRGYATIAVSSTERSRGCWNMGDVPRIQFALRRFKDLLLKKVNEEKDSTVIAIGASSGGFMAAELGSRGLVDASLVMVMSLQKNLQNRLIERETPLFLAPMARDKRTFKVNELNYKEISKGRQFSESVYIDKNSCDPIPLTSSYLLERVPGMKLIDAEDIVQTLTKSGHLNQDNHMFNKDPTQSSWREDLLRSRATGPDDNVLWDKYYLLKGLSPLAKAFHRAWAYHEYCSEVVDPALDFFERQFS